MAKADPVDMRRLAKVLDMTSSPSDGEALVAARKANAMVRRAGHTYGTLLDAPGAGPAARLSTREERRLREQLARERERAQDLERELATLRTTTPSRPGTTSPETLRLRHSLLKGAPLLTYERNALTRMETIEPRSRNEYFILWLASRYGLRRPKV